MTQFYRGAILPGGECIGGTQDNGVLRQDDPVGPDVAWTEFRDGDLDSFFGDGAYCAAVPNDAQTYFAAGQDLDLARTTDGGTTFERILGSNQNAPLRDVVRPENVPEEE